MLLSIIVPVYNVQNTLRRCVDSLFNQSLAIGSYEVILVNDGSQDNSLRISEELRDEHKNISIYSQTNQGLAAARNTGLAHANGDFVIFVDSDDWLLPNTIGKVLKIAVNNNLDICGYRLKVLHADGTFSVGGLQPFPIYQVLDGRMILPKAVNIGSACEVMYKKTFLENNNLRFSNGITHEDVDFNARVYAYAKRVMYTDIISYVYFYNPESLNRSNDISKIRKKILDNVIIAKHMRDMANDFNLPKYLRTFYARRCNSVIVADLLHLFKQKSYRPFLDEYISLAKKNNLYPIKGRTLSWKTTLIIPLLNKIITL